MWLPTKCARQSLCIGSQLPEASLGACASVCRMGLSWSIPRVWLEPQSCEHEGKSPVLLRGMTPLSCPMHEQKGRTCHLVAHLGLGSGGRLRVLP